MPGFLNYLGNHGYVIRRFQTQPNSARLQGTVHRNGEVVYATSDTQVTHETLWYDFRVFPSSPAGHIGSTSLSTFEAGVIYNLPY
jgi:hypothetical protein